MGRRAFAVRGAVGPPTPARSRFWSAGSLVLVPGRRPRPARHWPGYPACGLRDQGASRGPAYRPPRACYPGERPPI